MLGYDHDLLGASLHLGERRVTTLFGHENQYHAELDTPLAADTGLLSRTSRRLFNPSRDVLLDMARGGPVA